MTLRIRERCGAEVNVSEREFDVVVIGMGPGGEHVAEELARAGLAVAAVEDSMVGGECPYWGCVPSKMMIRAANLLAEGRRIPDMAGSSAVTAAWDPVATRIRKEATDDWNDAVAADRYTDLGGALFRGRGRICAQGRVRVASPTGGDDTLVARRGIVINNGTLAAVPPIDGLAGTPFWTNHEAIETEQVPQSLIVLGGGPIGAELCQVFARFGSRVTVVEAAERLLSVNEPEAGELIAEVFTREGIEVHTGIGAESVAHDGSSFTVTLRGGAMLSAERLLVATGRHYDLAALGIGAVGLDESARFIPVDENMIAAPGVWAIGDVCGKGAFTHISMYHSEIVIAQFLGRPYHPAEYHAVPHVTFTDPEVGGVGLTEAQAREQFAQVRVSMQQMPESSRGWLHKVGNDGFIKLVADAQRGILVGATSVGPTGGEVLSMLTLAVHAQIPVQRLREMIYAYPTFHRAVSEALAKLDSAPDQQQPAPCASDPCR
jgi:pyruvate/2-oxoglutarate dehydrogenase complex dihydrolipoamide dehydrogenase (E3) component